MPECKNSHDGWTKRVDGNCSRTVCVHACLAFECVRLIRLRLLRSRYAMEMLIYQFEGHIFRHATVVGRLVAIRYSYLDKDEFLVEAVTVRTAKTGFASIDQQRFS